MELSSFVRDVADFPKPGILFKDISPLLANPDAFGAAIEAMALPFVEFQIDSVVGVEARGFLFGPGIAQRLGVGFVPVRKAGKLPADTVGVEYSLEYGTDRLELHRDALNEGDRVLIVDDVLATGGTLEAVSDLIASAGAEVAGVSVLVDLVELQGATKLPVTPQSVLEVN